MNMIHPDEALARVLADVVPVDIEDVGIHDAHDRVLGEGVRARLTQPPFPASAMDGFAVRAADVASVPVRLRLLGESAAGHAYFGSVRAGEAVRIFTGAPVPDGADTVVIQENARWQDDSVEILEPAPAGNFVRPKGMDFSEDETLLDAGKRLNARDLMLAASMNCARLPVRRKPRVAIIATGDELVEPGQHPRDDQIISSVPAGLAAMITRAGGVPEVLGIAADKFDSLNALLDKARQSDIVLTIGGASFGAYDLVRPALEAQGCTLEFWKIAMRPGKPLIFGKRGKQRVLGLPGNPVSAMICTRVFVYPLIYRMLGASDQATEWTRGILTSPVEANGVRRHYMRGKYTGEHDGFVTVAPLANQDSSLVAAFASADCLIVREAKAPAASPGETVDLLPLDF